MTAGMKLLLITLCCFQLTDVYGWTDDHLNEILDYINEITSECEHDVADRMERIKKMGEDPDFHLKPNPFNNVQRFSGNLGPASKMGMVSETNREILKRLISRFNMNKQDLIDILAYLPAVVHFPDEVVGPNQATMDRNYGFDWCPYPSNTEANNCDPNERYRSIDGSCNNLDHPLWGRSFRPLLRELPADYADGVDAPREGVSGALPLERHISKFIFQRVPIEASPVITIGNMVFGQFLDHDIGRTALTVLPAPGGGTMAVTCGDDGCSTEGDENEACWPIEVPDDDPDFAGHVDCLKFVRSEAVTLDDCTLDQRQQLNQVTSYVDHSEVYGSTQEEIDFLRDSTPGRGKLVTTPNPIDPALKPYLPQKDDGCEDTSGTIKCFKAGDTRVNEQIGLSAMHTIFHRYHNWIEYQLHALNPGWDGEKLFQESRHINAAIWQNIVYQEFLPIVLGPKAMKVYDLKIKDYGPYDPYSPYVNAETATGFQTAAFRFGHSQISDVVKMTDAQFDDEFEIDLASVSFRPHEYYTTVGHPTDSTVDGLILSQMDHEAELMDGSFVRAMTRSLFTLSPPHGLGSDLPSINTHRGRDHGVPSYNRYREWCGLATATTKDELVDIPVDQRQLLVDLYDDLEDIDVFVGGSMEIPVAGGITGPLFTCMMGVQFRRYKTGDRFWFERPDPVVGFTEEQRSTIRKQTLARVQCDTMDHVEKTQRFTQLQPVSHLWQYLFSAGRWTEIYQYWTLYKNDLNERRPCSDLPMLDLSHWQE